MPQDLRILISSALDMKKSTQQVQEIVRIRDRANQQSKLELEMKRKEQEEKEKSEKTNK